MLYIGIDTGVHTGVAIWDSLKQEYVKIATLPIHRAMELVKSYRDGGLIFKVCIEDARKRKWIPNSGDIRREMGRRQGAGSVKRDATIWEDMLTDYGISFDLIPPRRNATKLSPEMFAIVTGWKARTSEHARDAAMLVFGRK